MSLPVGTRFGPYEITSPLGAGGMGEVYRAHDSRLGRNVAIKVLPQAVAADPDRLARFEREARVLASLNHPNIAHLHGLEQADGATALVMELVEGETLAERLARGPIPLDEALPIARQIAEALEAAHEQGIIHRDLKPANVKVRPEGTVKVLDFGLAKAIDPAVASAEAMNSPTLSAHATQQGVILGTAAYMSPEQAAGKPVDRRTDLWAFGVVLMEMLTARRVFDGESISHVIASVLRSEPEWTTLPSATPASIRRLLRQCLAKDPRRRLDSAAAARLELDDHTETDDRARRQPTPRQAITWAAIAAAVVLGAGWLLFTLRGPTRSAAPIRLTVELGAPASMPAEVAPNVALSPDGSTLAFVALTREARSTQLYVRRLDQLNAAALPGTENARNPFFSPDGRWVGFFDQSHAKLKKVPVAGGAPVTLADSPDWRGGDWSDENGIVFQARSGPRVAFSRISPDGGPPQPFMSAPDLRGSVRWPQVLPGGKGLLYTLGLAGQFEAGSVVVQPLPDGKPRIVLSDAYYGRFVSTGHILYMHKGTLFAAPFSLERLEVTGPPVRIVEGVSGSNGTGAGEFAVSSSGALMYVPSASSEDVISWMDRSGAVSPLRATSGIWTNPSFSPSGDRLAMEVTDGTQFSVWVYDLARGTETKLTSDDTEFSRPVWAPDGRFLAFGLRRGGALNLYWARADGADKPQRLVSSDNDHEPFSWHPSGALLAFVERTPRRRLMVLPISSDQSSGLKAGEPRVFLETQALATDPMFSPDGRWMAYASNETGRQDIYVRPFPGPGPKVSISSGGGGSPQWSPATRELLYRGADNRIMTVAYRAVGDAFVPGKPNLWSPRALPAGIMRPLQSFPFAVHPDGRRLALFVPPESAPGQRDKVVIILNFFTELRRLGQPSAR